MPSTGTHMSILFFIQDKNLFQGYKEKTVYTKAP